MNAPTKVFGIGFQKTGTKSLATALRRLGYRVKGPFGIRNRHIEQQALPRALRLAQDYDAFQDNPWPLLYRELDRAFPGSRFLLTVRDEDAWVRSVVSHFTDKTTPMRRWIYGVGSPAGHEDRYRDVYAQHNREVLEYFADRPGDLLVMHITAGEGWEQLCPFLGKDVPPRQFPHTNSADNRGRRSKRVRHAANPGAV